MSPETINALLQAFDRSDWREMTITVGSDRLHVSRDAGSNGEASTVQPSTGDGGRIEERASPAAASPSATEFPATTTSTDAPELPTTGTVIESPSVGLFWRAPAPGAPPFVEVGQAVTAGDTLAIVEVMKLMNHVTAPVDGTVTAILVENAAPVEYGQALVVVEPES